MDEKNLSEIRRKKLLDKAEARLRFIKEGIPWRDNENNSNETSQPDNNLNKNQDLPLSQDKSELTGQCVSGSQSQAAVNLDDECSNHANERLNSVKCKYNHMDPSPEIASTATFIREESGNLTNLTTEKTGSKNENISDVEDIGESSNPCFDSDVTEINLKGTEVKINNSNVDSNDPDKKTNATEVNDPDEKMNDTEVVSNDNELETRDHEIDSDETEVISNVPQVRRIDRRGLIPEELVRNIKAMLCESSNEREEQKRRTRELNINIWTSLFIMLCVGVITRISYAVGLSWLFKGVMFVPFFTVAVPRLIPMILNPPPPTGPLVQFLLMIGVKLKLLKQVFTVVSVIRMFLKLFSVFLIAFVFTHQVVESFFA